MGPPQILIPPLGIKVGVPRESCSYHYSDQLYPCTPTLIPHLIISQNMRFNQRKRIVNHPFNPMTIDMINS